MKHRNINKVVIAGGGTGGHLIPAFAIADALKKQKKDIDIMFIGSCRGLEAKLYKNRSEKYYLINIRGISRSLRLKSLFENIFIFPFEFIRGIIRVFKIFSNFKPDIVIGTGGYSSAIPLFVSRFKSIEIMLQEQNAIPGLVNKFFLKKASKVFFGFAPNHMEDNFINSGNPILLKDSSTKKTYNKNERFKIFIIGGSQGSVPINNHFINNYHKYLDMGISLIWQCGKNNVKKIKEIIISEEVDICGFIDPIDMCDYYSSSDLVISRAGALTLSELANFNIPSILIPFPHAANNHQMHNAEYFKSNKSAEIVNQNDLSKGELENKVDSFLADSQLLISMRQEIKKISKPNAASLIASEVLKGRYA